jgi:hypothetical protein
MSPEFDEDRLCGDIPNAGRAVERGRDDARAPSGLKAAARTIPSALSWPTALPVLAFQMRAVPSSEAVTMRAPSGLNDAE